MRVFVSRDFAPCQHVCHVVASKLPSCLPELHAGRVSCVTASEASCPDRVQLVQQLLCKGNATAFGKGLQD